MGLMRCILLAALLACVFGNEQSNSKDRVGFYPFNKPITRDGLPVPLPRSWKRSSVVLEVKNEGFLFNATGVKCDDLEAAFDRYYKMIFDVPSAKFSTAKVRFMFGCYSIVSSSHIILYNIGYIGL